ncbi:DNA-binding protein [Methanococcus voltae]|uniref:DNA-binding protein Alba n=1 Tax=Methanococcus voltae TaxID=2188 RepID=UPI001AE1615A|nr:DNA-binding protein Alba [Methanococcus voltae]MBP2143862.1 DNA-binding protein [Methanococcus voltae]
MANSIYVGDKGVMNYVTAVMTLFDKPDINEVVLKARGKSIVKAVDVEEVLKNRVMKSVNVKNIALGTEILKSNTGKEINVSTIEITLSKE